MQSFKTKKYKKYTYYMWFAEINIVNIYSWPLVLKGQFRYWIIFQSTAF